MKGASLVLGASPWSGRDVGRSCCKNQVKPSVATKSKPSTQSQALAFPSVRDRGGSSKRTASRNDELLPLRRRPEDSDPEEERRRRWREGSGEPDGGTGGLWSSKIMWVDLGKLPPLATERTQ